MVYYVYFLYSLEDNNYYIGCTKGLRDRVKRHNEGRVQSTKSRCPLKLVYYEKYLTKKGAFKREFYLKSPKGYRAKQKIIKKIKLQ